MLGNNNRSCKAGDQWGASTTQIFHKPLPSDKGCSNDSAVNRLSALAEDSGSVPNSHNLQPTLTLVPGELTPSAGLLSGLHTCSIDKLTQATDRRIDKLSSHFLKHLRNHSGRLWERADFHH